MLPLMAVKSCLCCVNWPHLNMASPLMTRLSTVFRALDPEEFTAAFAAWASKLAKRVGGAVVAIDGKPARGSKAG